MLILGSECFLLRFRKMSNVSSVASSTSMFLNAIVGKSLNQFNSNPMFESDDQSKEEKSVWIHFKRLNDEEAKCKHCGETLKAYSTNNGTSSLRKHVNICKVYSLMKKKGHKNQSALTVLKKSGAQVTFFTIEGGRKMLAKMLIRDGLHFSHVEGDGFKAFLEYTCPKLYSCIPSRTTMVRDCINIFFEEKQKLKDVIMNNRVSITTDTWTSVQNLSYVCLTAHFIDSDWKLQKRILNFCQVPDHKGETLGRVVERCLLDWGVNGIFVVTVDNASSNNGEISFLKNETRNWPGTICDHEYIHMRCTAHVLNIIVQVGLDDIDDSIIRIRNVVRYVRSSPPRLKAFKKCVEKIPELTSKALPSLDVPTRWNSTYMMLEAACRLGMAFKRLGKDDNGYNEWFLEDDDVHDKDEGEDENFSSSKGKKKKKSKKTLGAPKDDDWKKAEGLVKFLEVFYNATLKLSGSLYATSNSYFMDFVTVMSSFEEVQKNCDSIVLSVISRMTKKWTRYWNILEMNKLLFVAIVLDPRYKLKFIDWAITKIVDNDRAKVFTSLVKKALDNLYGCYEKLHRASPSNEARGTSGGILVDVDVGEDLASKFLWEMEQENASKDVSEVESYLNEFIKIEHSSFEVLNWWKTNSYRFPILSEIARDVLAFPVSSVASESAFSTAGRVIDPFRSSLAPSTVEALICTQDWLRPPSIAINLRASLEKVQEYEAVDAEMFAKFSTLSSNMED